MKLMRLLSRYGVEADVTLDLFTLFGVSSYNT